MQEEYAIGKAGELVQQMVSRPELVIYDPESGCSQQVKSVYENIKKQETELRVINKIFLDQSRLVS
jgi:hypothetical protein